MKKIFTLIAALAVTAGAMANEYTGPLSVMINGFGASQETTITINKQERAADADESDPDLYTLLIKNFSLDLGGVVAPVGNIELKDMPAFPFEDKNLIVANDEVLITAGDDPNAEYWLGPILCDENGPIPVSMVTKFDDGVAIVDIVIDMRSSLEQLIYVNFNNAPAGGEQGTKGDLNSDDAVNTGDVSTLYDIIIGGDSN